jgi:hypothetical protein
MAKKNEKRTTGRRDEPDAPNVPQAEGKGAAPGGEAERRGDTDSTAPEHRHRSQRTDLLDGDPAGTAYSEEMGHTPTRT